MEATACHGLDSVGCHATGKHVRATHWHCNMRVLILNGIKGTTVRVLTGDDSKGTNSERRVDINAAALCAPRELTAPRH